MVAALPRLPLADPAATCRRIGDLLATSMGGSSGVLLSIFFTAAGQKLAEGAGVADALDEGLDAHPLLRRRRPGDRTLIDALAPAIAALRRGGLAAAAAAAEAGAAATAEDAPAPAPAAPPTSAAATSPATPTPAPRPSPRCSPRSSERNVLRHRRLCRRLARAITS